MSGYQAYVAIFESLHDREHFVVQARSLEEASSLAREEVASRRGVDFPTDTLYVRAPLTAEDLELVDKLRPTGTEPVIGDQVLRDALAKVTDENRIIYRNLTHVQGRCTELLLKAREWRRKIIELGGEDPGPP
jgi:hypothetical protein